MRRALVGLGALALLAALVSPPPAAAAPDGHHRDHRGGRVTPCSRGLVALTFDDGPSATVTPRLTRLLQRERVPATFFMVGERVAAHPELVRLVERRGFTIGNHTWAHTKMTTQSETELRRAVRSTQRALVQAGVTPSRLMRPPYGAIDDRVRTVLRRLGYTPVLWTIDSRDWAGRTPQQIVAAVLDAARPHRTNLVLQHDGVANSPATLKALPREIATLRKRGYCFAALAPDGTPTPPVPVASVTTGSRRVHEGDRVRLRVDLDRPTSRPTTVRVRVEHLDTTASDVAWRARTVRFAVGQTHARLRLPIRRDRLDEPRERLVLRAGDGPATTLQIIDGDDPVQARLHDTTVTASSLAETEAGVRVRLGHRSGYDVGVLVRSPGRRTWVTIPAGRTATSVPIPIPAGQVSDEVHTIPVVIARTRHATAGRDAQVTVHPPEHPPAVAMRRLLHRVDWPRSTLPTLF